jgi:hypothetical protein
MTFREYHALQMVRPLNLDVVEPSLHAQATVALDAGDAEGFLCFASGSNALPLVIDNSGLLKARGLYEQALAAAWTSAKHSNVHCELRLLRLLLEFAERDKLLACGDPLPSATEQLTLYRGVAGTALFRWERGLSWSLSRAVALFFADRNAHYGAPAVLTCHLKPQHVYFYTNDRQEEECVVRVPPRTKITAESL